MTIYLRLTLIFILVLLFSLKASSQCDPGFYFDGTDCVECTEILDCSSVACSDAVNSICLQCEPDFYIDNSGGNAMCTPCQYNVTNVPAGFYLSIACDGNTTQDISNISPCTSIVNCLSVYCSGPTDSQCLQCDSDFYIDNSAGNAICTPCQYNVTNVPVGFYLSVACDGTTSQDISDISPCEAILNCGSVTCSGPSDSQCSQCVEDFYIDNSNGNAICTPCNFNPANVPQGSYLSSRCDGTTTVDVSAIDFCTSITNCISVNCTNPTDAQCSACEVGYFIDNSGGNSVCTPCQYDAFNVPVGFYLSTACDGTTNTDVSAISPCSAVLDCTSSISCTNATDSQCTSCEMDTYVDNSGSASICIPCQFNTSNVPDGFYLSVACDGTSNLDISEILPCTPIIGCAEVTCTNNSDQTCNTLEPAVEVESYLNISQVPEVNNTLNVLTLLNDGTVGQKSSVLRVSMTNDTLFLGDQWVIIPGISSANASN